MRTMWCPSSLDISPAPPADQQPKNIPITFLDKTNAPMTAALSEELKPYYHVVGEISYADPLHANPLAGQEDPMIKIYDEE